MKDIKQNIETETYDFFVIYWFIPIMSINLCQKKTQDKKGL
jgi:hypothetical protein